jgi:predicted transcriptional regulator
MIGVMRITLELSPELRDKLAEQSARLARPLEAVALEALEESFSVQTKSRQLSREEWQREFDAWIASHRPISHFVDDNRESIYGDDGR